MSSMLHKIRLAMAIVLVCAIFLPLSQCHHGEVAPPAAEALAHARHFFPQSDKDFDYFYGVKYLAAGVMSPRANGLLGALTLIGFLWPLGFAIWSRKSPFPRFYWIFYTGEVLLCAGTAYLIYLLTQGGRWLYGAYVGEVAISIYACTSLIALVGRIRNRSEPPAA